MSARPEGSAHPGHEDRGMSSRAALTSVLLLVALALSACGGSSSRTASTAAQTTTSASSPASASGSATTPSPSPSASTTSASTTSASTTTSASAPPLCTAPILAGSLIGQQGAAGTGLLGFALRNTSTHSCHTYGYPGVALLGASGPRSPALRAGRRSTRLARPIRLR